MGAGKSAAARAAARVLGADYVDTDHLIADIDAGYDFSPIAVAAAGGDG